MAAPFFEYPVRNIDLTNLLQPVHFNKSNQFLGCATEDSKRAPWAIIAPAFLRTLNECFHGSRCATSATDPFRHLIIFAGQMSGCILRRQWTQENYFIAKG